MFRSLVVASAVVSFLAAPVWASDLRYLGFGDLLTNDFLGDGRDRENAGSYAASRFWGPGASGELPLRPGELVELRFHGEIKAPTNLRTPGPGDRPYAGVLSLGLHTHFQRGATDVSFGGDLVLTGPQTGMDQLHTALHDGFGIDPPSPLVTGDQIEDGVHPTLVAEVGRSFSLGASSNLRPFLEGRVGSETMLRAGFDMTFGAVGQGEVLVRDPVGGQRYRTMHNRDWGGMAFVFGADIAAVSDSVYLPEDRGYDLTEARERVRAGVHWQGDQAAVFYGVSWLGKEYESQDKSQVVGSLQINLNF